MKKAYSAPRFYCESFEMHPIIGTECGEGIFFMEDVMDYQKGNITRAELLSQIVEGSGEELFLNHANSWDCYGAHYGFHPTLGGGMFTTFHTKNGGAGACDMAKLNALENLEYPVDMYQNVCYHIPLYQLLTFASV